MEAEKNMERYIYRESENQKHSIQPSIGQEKSRHIFTDMIGLKLMSKVRGHSFHISKRQWTTAT